MNDLVEGIENAVITGDGSVSIENIEYDSRLVKKNALFFAVKGYKVDGYDFVEQAVHNGAVAVMGERESFDRVANHVRVDNVRQAMSDVAARFYGYPGENLKVCGVTGTNGKTTTCFMLKRILEARGKKVGLVTSLVYDTGRDVFSAERTTPEALDMQRLLFLMKNNFCVNAVVEVSSHALALHRVDNIKFRVAVYTNLTRDHLDFHENMDNYLRTKALLLKKLEGEQSYAVINLDVEEFRPLFGELNSAYMTYSLKNSRADVYCGSFEIERSGTIFDLVTPMGTRTVNLKLPGRFNLINAIAAATGGLACGVDIDSVVEGLERVVPVPGRFNYLEARQPFGVYVDFAHTPDAIIRLCEAARELTRGRLLILFGCGGDRDKGKRPLMGRAALDNADYAVVTSDNPRSEEPQAIIDDIKPGLSGDRYEIIIDRKEAIAHILKLARPGDAVLLAGKGAENYQEVKGVKHPFDDMQIAGGILAEMDFKQATGDGEN
ncbi:MAG: UDP-N-acetylmuramoyl-L-alanyl-D-glutamate--2,6-diaminopimelate ligase [Candidatus Zixiibacteriota bacterium]